MDDDFSELLMGKGVKREVILKLEEEDIISVEDFQSLRKDELQLLFDRGVSVGQFSRLSRLWEDLGQCERVKEQSPVRKRSPAKSDFTGNIVFRISSSYAWFVSSNNWTLSLCVINFLLINTIDPVTRQELFEKYKLSMQKVRDGTKDSQGSVAATPKVKTKSIAVSYRQY